MTQPKTAIQPFRLRLHSSLSPQRASSLETPNLRQQGNALCARFFGLAEARPFRSLPHRTTTQHASLPGLLLGVVETGRLEHRVMRLLDERMPWARHWRVAATTVCVTVLGTASLGIGMFGVRTSAAQSTGVKTPAFEVTSIKKDSSDGSNNVHVAHFTSDGYVAENAWLKMVLAAAYNVPDSRISGIPSWANTDQYTIRAKVAGADIANFQRLKPEQRGPMLQALLAERFKLKAHFEDKDGPIYALVVAKDGLKLKEAKLGDSYADGLKALDGVPMGSGGLIMGPGRITEQGRSMQDFALDLNRGRNVNLDRPVVDRTGLTGKYDISLTWTPGLESSPGGDAGVSGPTIFTATQEQLGLKLEPARGLVKTLVIDHIERPKEN